MSTKKTCRCHRYSSVIRGINVENNMQKKACEILINRYPSLCQQNRHLSNTSLPKIVLSTLEDLGSISFLNLWQHFTCDDLVVKPVNFALECFKDVATKHFTCDDLDFHHCMATFHEDLPLFFRVCPNLLTSCCIPAIPRSILQSDVKDT